MDDRLIRLEARLTRVPSDEEAWITLARMAAKLDLLPGFLTARRHVPLLATLWRRHPRVRALGRLLLPLLRLELAPELERELPGPWAEKGLPHDSRSGFPVFVRRRLDGAAMVLVPADDGPPFYVDRLLSRRLAVARFRRAVNPACAPAAVKDPEAPALLSRELADRYAEFAGARLMNAAERTRAAVVLPEHAEEDGWLAGDGPAVEGEVRPVRLARSLPLLDAVTFTGARPSRFAEAFERRI